MNRKRIMIAVLIFVAVIGIVLSLNRYISAPWKIKTVVEKPIVAVENSEGKIVLEGDCRTILLLDKNGRVCNKVNPGILQPLSFFSPTIALTEEDGYFVITTYYPNSSLIESEKIIKIGVKNNKRTTVLECKYDRTREKVFEQKVLYLVQKGGEVFAITENTEQNAIAVVNISSPVEADGIVFDKALPSQSCVSLAWYDEGNDKIYIMDQFGKAFSWQFSAAGAPEEAQNFESEAYFAALYARSMAINGSEDSEQAGVPVFSNARYDYLTHMPDAIKALEGKSFAHTVPVQLRIWLFWLGVLTLLTLLLVSIVKSVRRLFAEKKYRQLRRAAVITGVAVMCLVIVAFYSRQIAATAVKHCAASQRVAVQMTHDLTQQIAEQAHAELEAEGSLRPETYNTILASLKKSLVITTGEDTDVCYSFSLICNGRIYPVVFTERTILSASLSRDISEVSELKPGECFSTGLSTAIGGFSASRTVYTDAEGNAIGTLYAYSDVRIMTVGFMKTCLDLFIKLFVGTLVFVYAAMEMIAWVQGFMKRRALEAQGVHFQGIALARPLEFLNIAVNSADSALIVLIIKDMLKDSSNKNMLFLCSLPVSLMGVGFLVGGIVSAALLKKYNAKKVLLSANVLEIAFLLGETWAVYSGNVPLLLIFMLLMTICNEISVYYARGYALTAPSDDLRRECNVGVKSAELSAYAVITILAGYAVNRFGNYAVYLIALIPALISLAIVCLHKIEDRRTAGTVGAEGKGGIKERLRFLLAPRIVLFFFCALIVSELLRGYKSYVFPLFADQGGISKASISNIQVFSKAMLFFLLPLLNRFQKKLGDRNIIILSNLVLGAVFLMFLFNQSVIWAAVTLIFTYIASKGISLGWLSVWQKYALDNNVDIRTAQSSTSNLQQAVNMCSTPVLSWLLGFGQIASCTILGVYLCVTSVALKLSGKKKDKE